MRIEILVHLAALMLLLASAVDANPSAINKVKSTRFSPVRCEVKGEVDKPLQAYVEQGTDPDSNKLKILFIAGDQTLLWMRFSVWQNGAKISPDLEHRLTIGGRIAFMIEIDRPSLLKSWSLPSEEPSIRAELHAK